MISERKSIRRLVLLSMLSACGLVFFVFESFLPLLPWFRPGLGNVATLLALMMFGFSDAVKVTILRVVLGALVLGRILTPVFLFALFGGLASVVVMALVLRYANKVFGPVGISVLGAVAHNMVQLFIAYLFFIKSVEIFIFTPVFLGTGVVTGSIVGIVAIMVFDKGGLRGLSPGH
ncbi:Gx transporter family protein [Candidatus Latescibacterota bacterium]